MSVPVIGYICSAKADDPRFDEWEAQIQARAAELGCNLIAVLIDEGISSATLHRPMLQKAIRHLRTQAATGVIIPSRTQLAFRKTDIGRLLARLRGYRWVEFIQE